MPNKSIGRTGCITTKFHKIFTYVLLKKVFFKGSVILHILCVQEMLSNVHLLFMIRSDRTVLQVSSFEVYFLV